MQDYLDETSQHSVRIVMTEVIMTVVAMMGILLKRPTVTIRSEEEFDTFESFKSNRYRPKWVRDKSENFSGFTWSEQQHGGDLYQLISNIGIFEVQV